MIQKFEFKNLELGGAYLIKPFYAVDDRGNFIKEFEYTLFEQNGIKYDIKEIFYSKSRKGTIRGLHFQYDRLQTKLVRCISGRIYDVIVDLRKESPTYRQWLGFYLDDNNNNILYVPRGFAHGFMAIEDNSIVSYKCDEEFYPEGDSGIRWDDEELSIEWPLELIGTKKDVIISKKDSNLQSFKMFERGNLK